jgi:hypothetical protein
MEIDCLPHIEYIGHMATFYVPRSKLHIVQPLCHDFFLTNYDAYTVEDSDIQGFWRRHPKSPIFQDRNVKYVVSFHGKDKIDVFVSFLSRLCGLVEEECIYLTMGYKSWLVFPEARTWSI